MALFRCLRSGNTVEISQPDDVERMKDHEGYVRVTEEEQHGMQQTPPAPEAAKEVTASTQVIESTVTLQKKRGRPAKVAPAEEAAEL
jgi:hypothetical protein